MANLEYIIRPFQSPRSLGAIVIPSTPQNTHEKATITWGATTKIPMPQQGIGFNVIDEPDRYDETSRDEDIITVGDNVDNRVFSQVLRPKNISFLKHTPGQRDNWDQFSGTGAEVAAALGDFAADVHSGTLGSTGSWAISRWHFAP